MLILAGTPIGNLSDASVRLRETLKHADLIACEDTRTTGKLLKLLDVDTTARMVAVHEHNERQVALEIAEAAAGQTVVMVSDAGMPGISDPGYPVVQACVDAGVEVRAVPGPSAVVTALAISGLPSDRFTFEGFVPRKASDRAKLIELLTVEFRTAVMYESPHRLEATLTDFARAWPQRRLAVCRELTKMHEQVHRGTCTQLADWAKQTVRGELVLVLEGASSDVGDLAESVAEVKELVAGGMKLKDASAYVARRNGLRKRELYDATIHSND